jgi:hypothetical protein
MPHIVLNEEQERVVTGSTESVEVHNSKGRVLAFLQPVDPALAEIIMECKRRLSTGSPGIPAEQVQAHMRKLDEIRQREGMDRDKMFDLLRRMRAGEEV